MAHISSSILGLMVQNYRMNGTVNHESAVQVVKSLAETNLTSQEIAAAFDSDVLNAVVFTEVDTTNADANVS